MTVETEVANLTTAVDNLAEAVNVKKATLDASVADAESARDAAAASATTASGHATSAAASAAAAASTASGIAGFDLDAIAETKAVTAVDVFVYDTSKDSDGGAWRKRTQHTSWYNETLNTATRGGRREFPAVAVIVAESNKVTIYDGDDPALPMWMVFNASTANNSFDVTAIFGHSGAPISSVSALNGEIVVGCSAVTSNLGVRAANFISDSAWYKRQGNDMVWLLTLADRNINDASIKWASIGSQDIVNHSVNDVAMTVLPDAPIDPATGLPVPTIAVATDGGVSVIKDDGTVVDITASSYTLYAYSVQFDDYDLVFQADSNSSATVRRITYVQAIPEADFVLNGLDFSRGNADERYIVAVAGSWTGDLKFALGQSSSNQALPFNGSIATEGSSGLNLLSRQPDAPTKGMIAGISSTYNTGWMPGDIKGAFLADTDDTDLVGSGELVTNGTFDTDTSGWTAASDGRCTISWQAGKLRISNVTASLGYAFQTVSTVVGKTYTIQWTPSQVSTAYATRVYWGNAEGTTSGGGASAAAVVSGPQSITFVATTTTTYVAVQLYTATAGAEYDFDNISIKLADADRSVNNKGLIVNGTITRTYVDEV